MKGFGVLWTVDLNTLRFASMAFPPWGKYLVAKGFWTNAQRAKVSFRFQLRHLKSVGEVEKLETGSL